MKYRRDQKKWARPDKQADEEHGKEDGFEGRCPSRSGNPLFGQANEQGTLAIGFMIAKSLRVR